MKICLDPWLGGSENGVVVNLEVDNQTTDIEERHLNLALARMLEGQLQRLGYWTNMCRRSDRTLSVDARINHANRHKANLYLGVTHGGALGAEVLHYPGSTRGQVFARAISAHLAGVRGGSVVDTSRMDVLRKTKMPAVVVRLGSMRSAEMLRLFTDDAYQERLAQAIALGVHAAATGERAWLKDVVPAEPMAADKAITTARTAAERQVAGIWNRYGGLLQRVSEYLGLDPALAAAVLAVESGGRAFEDGRLLIRFEVHQFYKRWGQHNGREFYQHFKFRADRRWQGHRWRPTTLDEWQPVHGKQEREWGAFDLARSLDEAAAYESISMGLPQIMGFNTIAAGYASAEEMFRAFERSEAAQVLALFDFVRSKGLVEPLLRGDLEGFAAGYNGRGKAKWYAGKIKGALEALLRLLPA